ncbi:MAG: hypothetical protein QOE45_1970 [Frankiaceae bacterium]|jgi:hypothetical protein|nr:hypothetical protein [Frankiaceae bacterium]
MTGDLQGYAYAVDTTLSVPPTRITAVDGPRPTDAPAQRLRLGEALVEAGVITTVQLDTCLAFQEANTPRRRLGAVVVELGFAGDVQVAQGLAAILGFEYVDPSGLDVPVDVAQKLPRLSAEMLGAVPVAAGPSWLRVAVADPTDRRTVEALRDASGVVTISLAVATPRAIEAALHRFWSPDYSPAAGPVAAPAEVVPEAPAEPAPVEEARVPLGGWEYTFVAEADLPGTERALARLGAEGWEAVGVHSDRGRLNVLLKRKT